MYPALGIKRGVSVTPIQTHMSWKDNYSLEDAKLCCLYHLRDDDEFKPFERVKLLGNKFFYDFKQVEEKKGVYVFDMTPIKNDWMNIINGKYSKISPIHKKCIRNFIGLNSPNLPYIDSFLYPDRYFKLYAEMMGVEEIMLRDVGELCDIPNLEEETLIASAFNLEIIKQNP